jgi:hypothetical protein
MTVRKVEEDIQILVSVPPIYLAVRLSRAHSSALSLPLPLCPPLEFNILYNI